MRSTIAAIIALALALTVVSAEAKTKPDPRGQVFAAESTFAATMAARDLKAFGSFVAPDAIFFGRRGVLRGNAAVVEGWKRFFEGPKAPFSWRPSWRAASASSACNPRSEPVGVWTMTRAASSVPCLRTPPR